MESEPAFSTPQKEVGLMVGLVHCSVQWSYPDKIRVFDSTVHVLLQRYTSEKKKKIHFVYSNVSCSLKVLPGFKKF